MYTVAITTLVTIVLLYSSVALALRPIVCNTPSAMHRQLTGRYGESVRFDGVTSANELLEIYIDFETGIWSIVVSPSRFRSCLLLSGDGWRGPYLQTEEH